MKNFILEVKNIKPCPGGHSCSLTANGKKVAYIAPEVLEWSSHNAMVDVLEFYGAQLELKNVGPIELEADWMERDAPSRKKLQMQAEAEQKLVQWIHGYMDRYLKAKRIKERCKQTVLVCMVVDNTFRMIDFCRPAASLKNAASRRDIENVLALGQEILNDKTLDEVMTLLDCSESAC